MFVSNRVLSKRLSEQKGSDLVLLAHWLASCSSKGLGINDAAVQVVKGAQQAQLVLFKLFGLPYLP